MHREIILTKDGSHTVVIPEWNVSYHSIHGAIQESTHVFIEAGLRPLSKDKRLHIFEMGFGTGLNGLLTLLEAEDVKRQVHYTAIELLPLEQKEIDQLNYCEQMDRKDLEPIFRLLHTAGWDKDIAITDHFTLHKINSSLVDFHPSSASHPFDLIYYDAFAPASQPELWTKEIFEKLYVMLAPAGVLVTYCSKSDVRKAMLEVGFRVEKIPGPPGKREMLRAIK